MCSFHKENDGIAENVRHELEINRCPYYEYQM